MTARMSPSIRLRPWRRGLVALLLGSCAAPVVAGAAQAAAVWLPPADVRPASVGLELIRTASDPAGNTIAVWQRLDDKGDSDPANNTLVIEDAFRPAGGSFGAPQLVSDNAAEDPDRVAWFPDVAMDGQGRALITWIYDNGTNRVVRARVRNLDGSLGPIQDLMSKAVDNDVTINVPPRLAVNANGQVAVLWVRSDQLVIYGTTGTIAGGFAPATPLAAPSGMINCAHVAIDPNGNALFAWDRNGQDSRVIQAIAKPSAAGFGSVALVTPDRRYEASDCPRVALDPQGRATVVWAFRDTDLDNDGTPDSVARSVIQYASRTAPPGNWAAGTFSGVGTVPALSEFAAISANRVPDVVVDADNTAVVVWGGREAPPSDKWVIQAASRPSGGDFGNRQTLSGPVSGSFFTPRIAVSANGDAVALWPGLPGATQAVQAARRPAGVDTSFGVHEDIDFVPAAPPGGRSQLFGTPEPAIDSEGNAIGAWVVLVCKIGFDDCTWTPRYAGLDAAPPALTNVSVPRSGTTGQALQFSVSAFDRWSGTNTSWSFGDGGTASGASVQHPFAAAGTYDVTVTSRDGVGNGASTTRTVQIQDPPAPPPASAPLAAPTAAGSAGIDADRDGFFSNQDCNDNDAAIRPNAQEIRGNRIDENCDGRADDFLAITSALNWSWHVRGARVTINRLIARDVPADGAVEFRCAGKRCPLTRKKAAKPRNGQVDVLKAIRSQRKRFRAGQTLEIRITAPNRIGKVVRFRLNRGRIPTGKTLCLRPSASRPAPCGP